MVTEDGCDKYDTGKKKKTYVRKTTNLVDVQLFLIECDQKEKLVFDKQRFANGFLSFAVYLKAWLYTPSDALPCSS